MFTKITDERRRIYQEFVNIVIDLLVASKKIQSPNQAQLLKKLYEFYKKYVVYASPKVINSFGDYFQYMYKNPDSTETKTLFKYLSKIMMCMRDDLGLSNKSLGKNGERIFRALLSDYDESI